MMPLDKSTKAEQKGYYSISIRTSNNCKLEWVEQKHVNIHQLQEIPSLSRPI